MSQEVYGIPPKEPAFLLKSIKQFHGFRWIFMDLDGFRWLLMDFWVPTISTFTILRDIPTPSPFFHPSHEVAALEGRQPVIDCSIAECRHSEGQRKET